MKTMLLMLLICAMPARAEFLTGEDLFLMLNGTEAQQAQALAYVKGVHDAGFSVSHCPPPLPEAQLMAVVRMALESVPRLRADSPADRFVIVPLRAMFPCMRPTSLRGAMQS